jgi:hypothetical protein
MTDDIIWSRQQRTLKAQTSSRPGCSGAAVGTGIEAIAGRRPATDSYQEAGTARLAFAWPSVSLAADFQQAQEWSQDGGCLTALDHPSRSIA